MGQKIHPTGFRLSVSRNWSSRWYASDRDFAGMLAEDIKVREYLKAKLKNAAASQLGTRCRRRACVFVRKPDSRGCAGHRSA